MHALAPATITVVYILSHRKLKNNNDFNQLVMNILEYFSLYILFSLYYRI